MRYLRRQFLDSKAVTGRQSFYIDVSGEAVVDQPYSLLVPKGSTAQRSPDTSAPTYLDGMIRYNTTTGEFEGRQDGEWRSFRFKEPGNIQLQTLSELGDGSTVVFGPLNPDPLSVIVAQSDVSNWDVTQAAKNILVLVENVVQIPGVNFVLVQNPAGDYGGNPGVSMGPGTYIQFATAVPANKPVYIFHNFDR